MDLNENNKSDLIAERVKNKEDVVREATNLKQKIEQGLSPTLEDNYLLSLIKRYYKSEELNFKEGELDILDNIIPKIKDWCDKITRPLDTVYNEETGIIHPGTENYPFEVFISLLGNDSFERDGIIVTERNNQYVLRDYILCGTTYYMSQNEKVYNKNSNEEIIHKIREVSKKVVTSPLGHGFSVLNNVDFEKLRDLHQIDKFASITTLIHLQQLSKTLDSYRQEEISR